MIYKKDKFKPLHYNYFKLEDRNGNPLKTREILYVKGIFNEKDTILNMKA